jgi:4'-phosphopantetheinyl transferase EntD
MPATHAPHSVKMRCHALSATIEFQTAILSPRLAELFPPGALTAELLGEGDDGALLPGELHFLSSQAAAQRRQEFAAGRMCARLLLSQLHISDFALRMAADRQPLWPDSTVGSITHTSGFCAAVVAEKTRFRAVGIDSEVSGSVKPELWHRLFTATEIAWLSALEGPHRGLAATLLFSAKESFYKLQYPLTGQKLGFHDATVEAHWNLQRGSFRVHAPGAVVAQGPVLEGRYLFHDQFVTTGMALR